MVHMQTSTVCNGCNASSSNLVFGIDINVMPLGVRMSMSKCSAKCDMKVCIPVEMQ